MTSKTKNDLVCPKAGCGESNPDWLRRLSPTDDELNLEKMKRLDIVVLCRRCRNTWATNVSKRTAREVSCNLLDPLPRVPEITHGWMQNEFPTGESTLVYHPAGFFRLVRLVFDEDLVLCGLIVLKDVMADGVQQLMTSPITLLAVQTVLRGLCGMLPTCQTSLLLRFQNLSGRPLQGSVYIVGNEVPGAQGSPL